MPTWSDVSGRLPLFTPAIPAVPIVCDEHSSVADVYWTNRLNQCVTVSIVSSSCSFLFNLDDLLLHLFLFIWRVLWVGMEAWRTALKIDRPVRSCDVVCSAHFEKSDFDYGDMLQIEMNIRKKAPRLSPHAIPHIALPEVLESPYSKEVKEQLINVRMELENLKQSVTSQQNSVDGRTIAELALSISAEHASMTDTFTPQSHSTPRKATAHQVIEDTSYIPGPDPHSPACNSPSAATSAQTSFISTLENTLHEPDSTFTLSDCTSSTSSSEESDQESEFSDDLQSEEEADKETVNKDPCADSMFITTYYKLLNKFIYPGIKDAWRKMREENICEAEETADLKLADGNPEKLIRDFKSILYHVRNIHEWQEGGEKKKCGHGPLTETQVNSGKWLGVKNISHKEYAELRKIITDTKLLDDLAHTSHFLHTGIIELYHSTRLAYTPKRTHYSLNGYVMRSLIPIIDHNNNTQRKIVATYPQYSKAAKGWVLKNRYEKKSYSWRDNLMKSFKFYCYNPTKIPDCTEIDKILFPFKAPKNIAPFPCGSKDEMSRSKYSRFT
ncbi:hypothetical protein B566_EDAN009757 [Ephemera danica]|nr:hypothetical protein B566_EDAN009757 [Ephemera danica]